MRIALLIYGSLETVSGGYLYDRKLVQYLRSQGDQVEIISIAWRAYASCLTDNFSARLYDHLLGLKVDLLLQDELNHPSLFLLNRRLRKEVRYPLVSIVHHLRSSEVYPTWQNTLYRKIEQKYLESIDAFIFNSQTTRETVRQIGVSIHNKPSIIAYPAGDRFNPPGNGDEIKQRAMQPGPLKIVFIGNLIARKGLHTLLQSLTGLPAQTWELTVIGSLSTDTGYVRKIQKFVSQSALIQQVKFLGAATDRLVVQTLSESHLLVVPSSYEGFGIVYLEGMSFGLPAIGTTAGGAQEIIQHGQNGFLIEPGDVKSLQALLAELAKNRLKLANLGVSARKRFEEHPTWDQTGTRIREFLISIIS